MPKVIYFHLWDSDDCSEGYFYTVSEKTPTCEQKQYLSSGSHMGIRPLKETIKTICSDLTDALDPENGWLYASVNELVAKDDDYHCRFSGPGELNTLYNLVDGKLHFDPRSKCKDILQIV